MPKIFVGQELQKWAGGVQVQRNRRDRVEDASDRQLAINRESFTPAGYLRPRGYRELGRYFPLTRPILVDNIVATSLAV
jgi:hypothetical protein